MGKARADGGRRIISSRFAVVVIAILFGASVAGWIATEIVPGDFPAREALYRQAWGAARATLVGALRLYDPFHSSWYRLALALFLVVLVLCIATRWRRLAIASWRVALPRGADELRTRELSFEISWRVLEGGAGAGKDPLVHYAERYGRAEPIDRERLRGHVSRIEGLLRRRGLAVRSGEIEGGIAFAASSGRWRSPGTMLFHLGILLIAIGGIIGSQAGWREMMYVREGRSAPLPPDSALTLRVDDFAIERTANGEIKDFVSSVTILDAHGGTVAAGRVEVNRPIRVGSRRIYQSEYTIDQDTFARARLGYSLRGAFRRGTVDLVPGKPIELDSSGITVTALRFFPDFRMSPDGPRSASPFPSNPALEVEVASGGASGRGWLFLYHGDFNTPFAAPVDLVLERLEPVYDTGLEVSANPGAGVLFVGFAAATLGLLLMYLSVPRVFKGVAGLESLVVAGTEYRWKASFEREFASLRDALRTGTGSTGV